MDRSPARFHRRQNSNDGDQTRYKVDRAVAGLPVDDADLRPVEIDSEGRVMISDLRQPVSISRRIVVTAPADT